MHPALIVVKKSTATVCLIIPGYSKECIRTGRHNLTGYISSITNTCNKCFFKESQRPLLLSRTSFNITCNSYLNAYQPSIIYNNPNDQPIKKQGV